jgi:hypothetical protein
LALTIICQDDLQPLPAAGIVHKRSFGTTSNRRNPTRCGSPNLNRTQRSRVEKGALRTANCELRAASCELRTANCQSLGPYSLNSEASLVIWTPPDHLHMSFHFLLSYGVRIFSSSLQVPSYYHVLAVALCTLWSAIPQEGQFIGFHDLRAIRTRAKAKPQRLVGSR